MAAGVLKNTYFSSINIYFEYLIGLFISILIARSLGPDEFGAYSYLVKVAGICIILTNVYTLISIYFYVRRWKVKKKKTINVMRKMFLKITQVMEVALVAVRAIQAKNDDHYVWISKQGIVFFEICLSNKTFFFNVMDIIPN